MKGIVLLKGTVMHTKGTVLVIKGIVLLKGTVMHEKGALLVIKWTVLHNHEGDRTSHQGNY